MSLTSDQVILLEDRAGGFRVWDHPMEGSAYVIGVDLSEGKVRDLGAMKRKPGLSFRRDRPDYSSLTVIEQESGVHVASWHGYLEPSELAIVVAAVAVYYNDAHVVPEINGPGLACVDVLQRIYSNIYVAKLWNKFKTAELTTTEYGWRTTQLTRPMLIARVHEWIAGDPKTRDEGLVRELRTMEYDDQGVPRGRGRNKDDRVFSLGLALQGRYENLTSNEVDAPRAGGLDPSSARAWVHVQQHVKGVSNDLRVRSPGGSGGPGGGGDVCRPCPKWA